MMKRFVKIVTFLIVSALVLTGCGYNFTPLEGGPSAGDSIENNGSLAVKYGNYLYMVNGQGTQSGDNTFNTPVKGALIRMELDAAGLPKQDTAQIVAPKIYYSTAADKGIYIFGGRIYYLSPSLQQNKSREILYTYTDVFSCKIDGTDTKLITEGITNSSFVHKFYEVEGTVYLVYLMDSNIYSINTSTKAQTTLKETYTNTPILADDGFIYYTYDVEKTGAQQEGTYESWNAFEKISPAGGTAISIKDKNGRPLTLKYNPITAKYTTDPKPFAEMSAEEIAEADKLALLKVTPTFVMADSSIYFSRTEGGKTYTYVMNSAGNIKQLTLLTLTTQIPLGYDRGILGTYTNDSVNKVITVNDSKTVFDLTSEPSTKEVLAGTVTAMYVKGNFFYYLNASSVLCKVDITVGERDSTGKDATTKLTTSSVSSSFLKPVVYTVSNTEFVLFITSSGDFTNYVSVAYILKGTGEVKDKIVEPDYGYIGVLTQADKDRLAEIIENENK